MRSLILLLAIALPLSANAKAKKKSAKPVEPPKAEFSFPVPQPEIEMRAQTPLIQEDVVTFEVSVSSWSPKGFTRSTYNNGDQSFERSSLPFLSLSRLAQLGDEPIGFYSKLGIAAASLQRDVDVTIPGGTAKSTQSLSLFSVRLGAEYRARKYFKEALSPIVSFAALPTLAVGSKSQLEGQVSTKGIPMEAGVAFALSPSFLPETETGLKNTSIGLGVHYLFGNIGGSKLDGIGAQGSLRVDL